MAFSGFSNCNEVAAAEHSAPWDEAEAKRPHLFEAPEVIESQGSCRTQASDVWSLGVLFYYVSCGRLPFSSEQDVLSTQLSWAFADRQRIKIGSYFKDFVGRMLSKNAQERPSCKELLSHPYLNERL